MQARYANQLLANLAAAGAGADALGEHMLGPIAYRAGRAALKQEYVIARLLAEKRERVVAEVVDTLAAAGIPVALLKGISYAGWLYADPGERPMRDIDLLVPPESHADARAVLVSCGFRASHKPHARSRLHHAIAMARGSDEIDLHRSIAQPVRAQIDLDRLWADTRRCEERGDAALRLDLVDEALFHFVNIARTQMYAPAINYLDGALLLARMSATQRDALVVRSRQWGVHRAASAAIEMTRALTEAPAAWVTPGLARKLLADPREVLRYELPPRPIQLLRKMILLDRPAQVVGFLLVAMTSRLPVYRD